jgi:quercetin dioxygenase-like cupin family protein
MVKKKEIIPIGKRIRRIRLNKKMSLDAMANETGISKEGIKKIESGELTPSVGTLIQLSKAMSLDSGHLLSDDDAMITQRTKAYTMRTQNYAYTSLTPEGENKHLRAFQILIEAKKNHDGVGFQHQGEEFVTVLQGRVEVQVGDHINTLETGDSLHFNSGIKHDLKNIGKSDAKLIVVVYTP